MSTVKTTACTRVINETREIWSGCFFSRKAISLDLHHNWIIIAKLYINIIAELYNILAKQLIFKKLF